MRVSCLVSATHWTYAHVLWWALSYTNDNSGIVRLHLVQWFLKQVVNFSHILLICIISVLMSFTIIWAVLAIIS